MNAPHHFRTNPRASTAGRAMIGFVLAASMGIGMSACQAAEPIATPTPTASTVDPGALLGGTLDPAGTTWVGTDSGGDQTTLTLHPDGTLAVAYGANHYDYPGDTWMVKQGVLHASVYLDEQHGTAMYVGTWDAATGTISAVLRTTRSAKELTVTLNRG